MVSLFDDPVLPVPVWKKETDPEVKKFLCVTTYLLLYGYIIWCFVIPKNSGTMVGGKKVLQLLLFFFFEETSAFAVGLRRQPCTLPVALSWSPGRLVCCLAFDDEIVGLDAATKDEMEVIAPKQDVKCPDCNLCDGSGRCAH
jgi:hypothetical protein